MEFGSSGSNSRAKILDQLRRQIVPEVSLPEVVDGPWITYPDPVEKFVEMVRFAGGSCELVSDVAAIDTALRSISTFQQAKQVFSAVPGIHGNVEMAKVQDAHELENLDFVVYPGQLAVAENGAVWLSDRDLRHRVCFFITQFLVLVVRREQIVHNMHQAYALAKPPQPGFGLFLAGPSKTADIEQSLVIGAHGCRELQVFVL
jgi:L-lactate dehydrogenase complex protein LldG